MNGELHDTYVAALRANSTNLPEEVVRIGVVRRPTGWFRAEIDENLPVLGPPECLLDEFHERREELHSTGIDKATAHNTAMDDIGFDNRYLEYLRQSAEAGEARERLRRLLADGTDIALVCYENTDEKRCHRTILKRWI